MVTSLRSKWAAGKAVRAGLAEGRRISDRHVTDEQRSRRPIFNATLRAAAGWLFFRVARSLRINLDMLVARALKNSQLTSGEVITICETVH
jgi:hypothetical protein